MGESPNDTPRPALRVIETGRAERLVNVRYEDLLRVVGYFVDQHKWHDVLVTQVPDGILLKGLAIEQTPQGAIERIQAIHFTNDQIVGMLDEGFRRREAVDEPPPAPKPRRFR